MIEPNPAPSGDATTTSPDAPQRTLRLRYPRTVLVPIVIGAVCALPAAIGLGPWGLLLALPFILITYAVLRIGADITPDTVVVHGILGSRTLDRSELVGFNVPDGAHVHLVRRDGSTVRVPTARPRDLPRLRTILFPYLTSNNADPEG